MKLRYQHPSGQSPLLSVVLVDGGEGRIGARSRGDVVEANYRDVLGNGDAPLCHPFHGAQRELVAQGEDGRRPLRTEQRLDGPLSAFFGATLTLVNGHLRPGQTSLFQRSPVAP